MFYWVKNTSKLKTHTHTKTCLCYAFSCLQIQAGETAWAQCVPFFCAEWRGDWLSQSHRGAFVSNNSISGPTCFACSSTITAFSCKLGPVGFGIWSQNHDQTKKRKIVLNMIHRGASVSLRKTNVKIQTKPERVTNDWSNSRPNSLGALKYLLPGPWRAEKCKAKIIAHWRSKTWKDKAFCR